MKIVAGVFHTFCMKKTLYLFPLIIWTFRPAFYVTDIQRIFTQVKSDCSVNKNTKKPYTCLTRNMNKGVKLIMFQFHIVKMPLNKYDFSETPGTVATTLQGHLLVNMIAWLVNTVTFQRAHWEVLFKTKKQQAPLSGVLNCFCPRQEQFPCQTYSVYECNSWRSLPVSDTP